MPNPQDVARKWYVVDGSGIPLGRLLPASCEDHSEERTCRSIPPHGDTGDFVIIVNAQVRLRLRERNWTPRSQYHHSLYPGGLKSMRSTEISWPRSPKGQWSRPKGMLPHNRLGDQMFTKLKDYAGPEHPHAAQKPEPLVINVKRAGRRLYLWQKMQFSATGRKENALSHVFV